MYIIDNHIHKEIKAEDIITECKVKKENSDEKIKYCVEQYIASLDDLYFYSIPDMDECVAFLKKEIKEILKK